jgi:Rps23 Pro-64 3,4-dihydroxylase Tpa1-like proline 4-hydroxylase
VGKDQLTELIVAKLEETAEKIKAEWLRPIGTTTRHFIVDDLLPESVAHAIYDAFPRDGSGFFSRESFREKKRTSANLDQYAPILADITYAFQDPRTVKAISDLIGFTGIEPDPSLYAGGLSMMFKGDFLNPHIDNSHDAKRDRYRRLNLLYYVTPDWISSNGGNFELWDSERKHPMTIVSKFNRFVVMETNRTSWHSASPVQQDITRCCVSNYYFSETSPDESNYFHVTSFTGRPNELVKKAAGVVDNALRNTVSKALKIGRGKDQANNA